MGTFITVISVILGVFVLFLLAFLFIIAPSVGRREKMKRFKNLRYAHRGLHDDTRPENSLSAFRAAVDADFAIELDVRLSGDGVLVVFHDDTLERAAGVKARVDKVAASELKKVKIFGTDEGIPTFAEVLELVGGRVPLLVEIKEDAGKYCVTEKTIEALSKYNGPFVIESFNPLALGLVKKKMPRALRGVLSENFLEEKKYRKLMYFLLQFMLLNVVCRPDFIAFSHTGHKNAALKICRSLFKTPTLAWTVRSEREERVALWNKFDGVIFENYLPAGREI
jgi:glycerophosphoryl diester phosphodiesterase